MNGFESLLLYVIWMLVLTLFYAFPRVPLALTGKKPIDSWERNKPVNDPALLQRAKGAHLNCVEGIGPFAAVVVVGSLMGQSALIDSLALYVAYARIAQGVSHLLGTSFVLVLLRATFFLAQVAIVLYLAFRLFTAGG